MANIDFEEIKQKAKDTVGAIADVSAELYRKAEAKTKTAARIAKLTAEITRDKGAARRVYEEIGKKYYELHSSETAAELSQLCAEVTTLLEGIDAKQAEINELKSQDGEAEEDVEVEIVEEAAEKVEDTCECAAEKVEEACEDVAEKAEEVCECAAEKVEEAAEKVEDACGCCGEELKE